MACIGQEGSYDAGMIYDTLQMARRLEGPFSREQATALTEALATSTRDTIASKEDLASLRSATKEDIANLRSELKEDIANLRSELKEDIANLRSGMIELKAELKGDIADLKAELIKWIVGAIVLNLFGTAGLVITLTKILAH